MQIRGADACMDPWSCSITQSLGGNLNIFLHRTAQPAYNCFFNGPRDPAYALKIPGTGNREPCFNNIHPKRFELKSELDFFFCIQLTTRHLFAVTQRGIEY